MIERASTCLEVGGRHLLRTTKPSLRNRRALHTAFWHHGASDLSLPIWWASATAPEQPNGDDEGRGRACSREPQGQDGQLLDFLYPQKALALIHRLSRFGSDGVDAHRRHGLSGSGVRHFSTSSWKAEQGRTADSGVKEADPHEERLREINLTAEVEERIAGSSAPDALLDLVSSGEPGKQDVAWRIYGAIPEPDRSPSLQADLLDYLASDAAPVANDILHVFDAIPPPERRASSYRAAISAYLALEMIGPAVTLYEEAVLTKPETDIGTDILLASAVHDNQWALALRVMRAFRTLESRSTPGDQAWGRESETYMAVWGEVAKLPYLRGHLHSFLVHVDQFKNEIARDELQNKAMQHLLFGLFAESTEQALHMEPIDEDAIWDFLMGFLFDLDSKAFRTGSLYEYAIQRLLRIERYREYTNRRKVVLGLYRAYRNNCETRKKSGTTGARQIPTRELLRVVLLQVAHHGSEVGVANVISDYRLFYPQDKLPYRMLRAIINFYAELGRIDEVRDYFKEYQEAGYHVEQDILAALPYAYARRVDVKGAEEQFRRISDEFGYTPDTTSWNVLILAYTRADDLQGALTCFNEFVAANGLPDTYTFNTLLSLCAARGDVEAYEVLYARAEQFKVTLRSDMYARSGFVQALLNFGDPEGAEATAYAMLEDHRAGTLPGSLTHAWNLLIQHYALNADLNGSRRIYKQMVQHQIPFDSWTYGSLMRALVEVKQTNAAYKILRVTMPANGIRVHAFHYAVVIVGYLKERQYELALKANRRMQNRGLPQTVSSRVASLLAIGTAEMKILKDKENKDPRKRLEALELKLRDMLLSGYEADWAYRQPAHRQIVDSKQDVPDDYFGLLITLYGARGALSICKEMFEAVALAHEEQKDYEPPITLLTAIMDTHLRAGEYDEVAKCWQLARAQADKLVETVQKLANPPETLNFEDVPITDPQIVQHAVKAPIAKNRRQALFKATRIYMRSLLAQENRDCLSEMSRTFKDLLTSGFVIDNLTWNEYIQALARRGHLLDAFTACEAYLMDNFPGWRQLSPYYIRHDRPGYLWMELRHEDITKRSLLPRYKTLVILARAWAQVRKAEANGVGYNPEVGAWTREMLEQSSPMTVRAIETMPRTGDPLQRRFLDGFV